MQRRLFIILLLMSLAVSAQAQRVEASKDTVIRIAVPKEHNPNKALLLSIIPGAGQIYNGQAWKVPIFYAALGGVGYFVYDNYTNMRAFKNEYLHRINNGGERVWEEYASYPDNSIYNMYQTYNKNFQQFVLITAVVYGINLLDAYVFGHLYDFNINDDLAMSIEPSVTPLYTSMNLAPSLQVSFRF